LRTLVDIATFLIQTAFGFFISVLLLRFWMQVLRAPFRNPIGQFITAFTNWAVLPARRVIPGLMGFDIASILIAWIAAMLMLALVALVAGADLRSLPLGVVVGLAFLELLRVSLYMLVAVVLFDVIIGWVNPQAPVAPIFTALTRPFYRPFRRVVPPVGGMDLSPFFVLVLAFIVLMVLGNV
jgi:YggT family protein